MKRDICVVATFFYILATATASSCEYCAASVLLNNARADCFLDQYGAALVATQMNGRGFVAVSLEKCSGEPGGSEKGVVSTIPEPQSRSTSGEFYYLDERRLVCLNEIVLSRLGEFDPETRLFLDRDCPTQEAQ